MYDGLKHLLGMIEVKISHMLAMHRSLSYQSKDPPALTAAAAKGNEKAALPDFGYRLPVTNAKLKVPPLKR